MHTSKVGRDEEPNTTIERKKRMNDRTYICEGREEVWFILGLGSSRVESETGCSTFGGFESYRKRRRGSIELEIGCR